jgi:hypothetical protein
MESYSSYSLRSKGNTGLKNYPLKLRRDNKPKATTSTTIPKRSIKNLSKNKRKACRQELIAENRAKINASIVDDDGHDVRGKKFFLLKMFQKSPFKF